MAWPDCAVTSSCLLVVLLLYLTYPISRSTQYSLVVQVGHWLGLEHTFNNRLGNTCDPADPVRYCEASSHHSSHSASRLVNSHLYFFATQNDFVADTPQMAVQKNLTCPEGPDDPFYDTCPDLPGVDAIQNCKFVRHAPFAPDCSCRCKVPLTQSPSSISCLFSRFYP